MTQLKPFTGIIFDLDGLILDTETSFIAAWQFSAQEMGFTFPDDFFHSLSGLEASTVFKRLVDYCAGDFDITTFQNISGQYWQQQAQIHGIQQKYGILELLSIIKTHQIPFCIATNSTQKAARTCLSYADLESVFELVISAEDVQQPKPEADVFLYAAECLQQPVTQCLVLEDSFTGIQAAKAAGAQAVLIPSMRPVSDELVQLCDAMFDHLAEVAEIIAANFP